MTKKEFYFSSANEKARMRAVEWLPEGEPKAVLHLFHGVPVGVHHYEELAKYFTEHGFIVIHNEQQKQEEMHICLKAAKERYPDVPYLLMGLSQGALAVSSFISRYPGAVEGVVLADATQEHTGINRELPVLQLSGVEANQQEAFCSIYSWTEERLDEMLYRAAIKQ